MKEKTYVDDVDRSIYDIRNEEKDVYRVQEGSCLDDDVPSAIIADL